MKHQVRSISLSEIEKVDRVFSVNKEQLKEYADLLLWWNTKINLVSRDVSRETVMQHVRHSLFVSLFGDFQSPQKVVDTGSGGGLPGLPLSICYPKCEFVINDIVSKKVFSVNDMINKLGFSERTKSVVNDIEKVELPNGAIVISKHAFKADELFSKIRAKKWSSLIMLKGYKEAQKEIEAIDNAVESEIIRLDHKNLDEFYTGKGVVKITRVHEKF